MIDQDMKKQLEQVFAQLENKVSLVMTQTGHAEDPDLEDMLKSVAETSSQIEFIKSSPQASSSSNQSPQFTIRYKDKETGLCFKGIPGGHEFTSLILGILHADGKGKFPDPLMIKRIKKIKKPLRLRTFMSLSCENCPDVVQALNQIALIHGDMVHEVVDGAYFQNEVQRLAIQGVPSILVGDELLHSGRIQLLDLVSKLEKRFGIDESLSSNDSLTETNLGHYDVVVIGGGPAGASSAIYTVRKGLKTAILTEKIGGQVQETKGIENLISVPYTEGPKLSADLFKHIQSYPIQVFENRRVKSISKDDLKQILLESGEKITADSIIVATGAKWRELNVPGEKEYIGRGVAFCPHCDGPYYKGKKVVVIGGGNSGVEAALDLAGIVDQVTVIEYNEDLKADAVLVEKLKSTPNIDVITSAKTLKINGDGQKVIGLEYQDRRSQEVKLKNIDGVFIQIGLIPNSGFLKDIVELTKFGEIVVDSKGRTSTKGIYAAGDVTTTPYKQIIIAMGEGAKAALAAFEDRMMKGAGPVAGGALNAH